MFLVTVTKRSEPGAERGKNLFSYVRQSRVRSITDANTAIGESIAGWLYFLSSVAKFLLNQGFTDERRNSRSIML